MRLEELLAKDFRPLGYVTVPTGCNTTEALVALVALAGPHVLCVVPKSMHGHLAPYDVCLVSPQKLLYNRSLLCGYSTVLVAHRKDPLFGERTVHAVWRKK